MTRDEALAAIAEYERDPDGVRTCDLLCTVLDWLPGSPEGEYTSDEVRAMVLETPDDGDEEPRWIEACGGVGPLPRR